MAEMTMVAKKRPSAEARHHSRASKARLLYFQVDTPQTFFYE
jgi:hypothetical protein